MCGSTTVIVSYWVSRFFQQPVRSKREDRLCKMASSQTNPESWYISLLGLSESFRTSNPPNLKLCIHCLQSVLNFQPPPIIESRTHLQLGSILVSHTKNGDLARTHLEKSVSIYTVLLKDIWPPGCIFFPPIERFPPFLSLLTAWKGLQNLTKMDPIGPKKPISFSP